MKCPHCGQEHPDDTKFCPQTGKKIESQSFTCNNPACDYRQPLPISAKFCPNCGKELLKFYKNTCGGYGCNNLIIVAYEQVDEEDGFDPESQKYIKIFKNNNENILYEGIVNYDSFNIILNEHPTRIGNRTFINIQTGFNEYIEVSSQGVKTGLTGKSIRRENFHGNSDCSGFKEISRKDVYGFKSIKTGQLYHDIYGSFLINENEKGDTTFFDIFDRHSEDKLHSRIPVKWGSVSHVENQEFTFWLPIIGDDCKLLVNKYNYFCLEENEIAIENGMYDPYWKPGYLVWYYCSPNRILTTFQYDDYLPNHEEIKIIRMRDENGNIIKEINADGLFLKYNFKYGRCLAIKEKRNKKIIVYIDEDGDLNEIPNSRVNGDYQDIECFFVTEDVLVIKDKEGATMLTTQGEVIFECSIMRELPGALVEYYDYDIGKNGIVDCSGNIIIPAEYETFDVIAE